MWEILDFISKSCHVTGADYKWWVFIYIYMFYNMYTHIIFKMSYLPSSNLHLHFLKALPTRFLVGHHQPPRAPDRTAESKWSWSWREFPGEGAAEIFSANLPLYTAEDWYPPYRTNSSHLKMGLPQNKSSIPTIHFQVRTVSFRGCMSLKKGRFPTGNTSSNHWFLGDMLVFGGVIRSLVDAIVSFPLFLVVTCRYWVSCDFSTSMNTMFFAPVDALEKALLLCWKSPLFLTQLFQQVAFYEVFTCFTILKKGELIFQNSTLCFCEVNLASFQGCGRFTLLRVGISMELQVRITTS